MSLTLHFHPLASFCWKPLIAFYENDTPFTPVIVDLGDEQSRAAFLKISPPGKMPALRDDTRDCTVLESTIVIEYLAAHYPGPVELIPGDVDLAIKVRQADRFYDFYVQEPMQKIVTDRLRPEGGNDPVGVAHARNTLDTAYAMIDGQLAGREWVIGDDFTIADCAAAPCLFFSSIVHPFGADQDNLRAYLERLLARPAVKRTLAEAQPFFSMFPYRDAMPERFASGAAFV